MANGFPAPPPAPPPPPPPPFLSSPAHEAGGSWGQHSWKRTAQDSSWQSGWDGGSARKAARWQADTSSKDWQADAWSQHAGYGGGKWSAASWGKNGNSTGEPPALPSQADIEKDWKIGKPLCVVLEGACTDREVIAQKRSQLEVAVTGENVDSLIAPVSAFEELAGVLPAYVTESLREAGISSPMAIQAQTLPLVLRGHDLIGIAKTGSGKTLAFLLPAIVHVEAQDFIVPGEVTPIVFALAPVRELAVQIAGEANKVLSKSSSLNHPKGIGAVCIYGGGARCRWQQVAELQKGWCHIVVGTPGRVVDLLSTSELSLRRVSFFVLDEADRMLNEGFGEQMSMLSKQIQTNRQTLFFSATWPSEVQRLACELCRSSPMRVSVGQLDEGEGPAARGDIVQEVVIFDGDDWKEIERQKQERLHAHLYSLLKNEDYKILVFVNMKAMTWELAGKLNEEGFKADFMYGGRSQDSRAEVVRKFKEGETKLLVTTDVMSRGLDIPNISHVVVYDCYGDIDEYVHRIGRTARGPYGQGHALIFFEYDPKFSAMPEQLVTLLEQAGQVVPQQLRTMVEEVASGQRKTKWKGNKW